MSKPTTHDEYLAALPAAERSALEKLRAQIRKAAPQAEECISYGLCAYRQGGMLVSYGAMAKHCLFHVMSATLLGGYQEQLAGFSQSKGGIHFQPGRPIPAKLVSELVKARLAENLAAAKAGGKSTKPAAKAAPIGKAALAKRAAKESSSDAAKTGLDPKVTALVDKLDHPLRAELETVRGLILAVSDSISEGVKWNSASYQTSEWFATWNHRSQDSLQFVLHTGAKAKGKVLPQDAIPDPAGLLKWLAPDRALATLGSGAELKKNSKLFAVLLREWIRHV